LIFSLLLLRPPRFTLFPYTTLFRSDALYGYRRCAQEVLRIYRIYVHGTLAAGQYLHYVVGHRGWYRTAGFPVELHLFDVLREERSEEHTSELQSRENLVCRLLLEKK